MTQVHDGATLRTALSEIAGDFSFSWIAEARRLFTELDPRRFAELHHNPTALLSELTDEDLARFLTPAYLEQLERVDGRRVRDRGEETWWRSQGGPAELLVAYFSAEFGLDESLPVYSGGLGVLAGDNLKAASELGVPLVGVGLFYRRGYFRQRLDAGDRQLERYPRNDTSRLPLAHALPQLLVHLEVVLGAGGGMGDLERFEDDQLGRGGGKCSLRARAARLTIRL